MKNKMFFFFNYDGQRNQQPNSVLFAIPSLGHTATANEQKAIDYLTARSGSYNKALNQDTYMLKYDWNMSQRNQLSARWNRQRFTGVNYENGIPSNALEHTGDSLVHSDTFTSSLTSSLSNSTINVFRFTYLRDQEPGKANSNLPEAVVKQGGQTILTVGRNSFSPRETTIQRQQYADTLSYVRGRHTLKVGGDAVVDKILNFFPGNFSGAYTFNSLEDFGASLNGVATSTATTYAQAFAGTGTSGPRTNPDMLQASWFIQDDWRAHKNLTINLGLRYDIQSIKQPSVTNFTALSAGYVTSRIPVDKNNVAPRIGFAWSPLGNDKWVFRGGYGMFYGNTPSIMIGTAHSNNGINVGTLNFNGTNAPTYPNTKCGAPVDSPNCPAPTGVTGSAPSIYVFSQAFQQPLIQQANFGTEYALTPDVSVAASYLWVKADHLQRTRDVNLGTPTPQTITFAGSGQTATYLKYGARPIAAFQRISQFESTADSVYNGMNLELKKRFSHNFQGSAAYTWSHVIDTMPDATAVVPFSSGDDAKMISDPKNIALDRASGVNDQRHRFTLSWVWELKYGQNLPSYAKAVFGGWDLSGVFVAQSGQPYSGTLNSDLNGDSNRQNDRTPGMGRNAFRMPATWTLDPRLTKNVQISERLKLQAFVEAFNLFNRFNVVSVRTQQYAVSGNQLVLQDKVNAPKTYFGMPTSPLTPNARILQLGAKMVF
ncbi:MAG TPA: hypothetical protein VD837_00665 [Terriglobales bacterium]|nr:hypothetical protein [Terriglobales bacterium]